MGMETGVRAQDPEFGSQDSPKAKELSGRGIHAYSLSTQELRWDNNLAEEPETQLCNSERMKRGKKKR